MIIESLWVSCKCVTVWGYVAKMLQLGICSSTKLGIQYAFNVEIGCLLWL